MKECDMRCTQRSTRMCISPAAGMQGFACHACLYLPRRMLVMRSLRAAALQVQGDFVDKAADLIVKTYKDKGIEKKHIFAVVDKRKGPFFDEEDDED